jgi:hypothetical protein
VELSYPLLTASVARSAVDFLVSTSKRARGSAGRNAGTDDDSVPRHAQTKRELP